VIISAGQSDSAPAHQARDTVELLRREAAQFIRPANSLDLNPVDYRIWGTTQQRVWSANPRYKTSLWRRLVETWAEFQQSVVDDATDQWRERLEACVHAKGGHFEHDVTLLA